MKRPVASEPEPKDTNPPRPAEVVAAVFDQLGDLSIDAIYRDRILSQRTRRYELRLPKRRSTPEILHTLLGIEVKIGQRRLMCPDLATARYLSVFARLGCEVFAVPYDITQTSRLADELESSWHRTLLFADDLTRGYSDRQKNRIYRRVVGELRARIAQLGAGPRYPQFELRGRRRRS
jgi:hypothetical protein